MCMLYVSICLRGMHVSLIASSLPTDIEQVETKVQHIIKSGVHWGPDRIHTGPLLIPKELDTK